MKRSKSILTTPKPTRGVTATTAIFWRFTTAHAISYLQLRPVDAASKGMKSFYFLGSLLHFPLILMHFWVLVERTSTICHAGVIQCKARCSAQSENGYFFCLQLPAFQRGHTTTTLEQQIRTYVNTRTNAITNNDVHDNCSVTNDNSSSSSVGISDDSYCTSFEHVYSPQWADIKRWKSNKMKSKKEHNNKVLRKTENIATCSILYTVCYRFFKNITELQIKWHLFYLLMGYRFDSQLVNCCSKPQASLLSPSLSSYLVPIKDWWCPKVEKERFDPSSTTWASAHHWLRMCVWRQASPQECPVRTLVCNLYIV